jgi:hypothetical protein
VPSAHWNELQTGEAIRASTAISPRRISPGRGVRVERARLAASRALGADPNLREAQFNLSLAFEGLRRTDDARAAWTRYLEMDPNSSWATEARQHLEAVSRQ